ncbi:MAG: MFS transporter [Candidatus Hodarchaeota archaeon]
MVDLVGKFFGLKDETDRVKRLAKVAAIFMPFAAFAFMMSTTFYSFYVAITLAPGNLNLGFAFVGILASVTMAVQLTMDYPTGGIGDWIGQRWILASAFLCFALSFFLTWMSQFFPYFWFFVIIYIISAIGAAQQSGAIAAWFDNNYRAVAKDPERKAYSIAQGRMGMLFQISATGVLIPGAFIATLMGREFVFLLQAIFCIIIGVSSLLLFRDFPEVIENRPKRSLKAYYGILREGLSFAFSSRYVAFYIIGSVLMSSTIIVWGNMILFYIYYSYLAYSDIAVALFRTILFATSVIWVERAGVWTRKLAVEKWIPRAQFLQTCGPVFYFVVAIVTLFLLPVVLPFPFMYFQIPTILICLSFILSGIFSGATNILNQRLVLDMVPDKIRNGIYSLFPSLTFIFAVPQMILFAFVMTSPSLSVLSQLPLVTVLFGLGIISLIGLIILRLGLQAAPKLPPSKGEALPKEEIPIGPIPVEPT